MLKQPQDQPLPVEKQVVILYAVVHGLLEDVPAGRIADFQAGLFAHLDAAHRGLLDTIRETGKLDEGAAGPNRSHKSVPGRLPA